MSTDVDSLSIFRLQNEYTDSTANSKSGNARFLLRRRKGLSKISQSKLNLNGFMDETESRKSGRRPPESRSKEHRSHNPDEEMDSNIDVTCTKLTRTITVHETYQLGYFDSATDAGLLERFVTSDALPADLPPLFLEPEYVDQLSTLASNALNQLTSLLNNWLMARQKSQEERLIWYHMSAHEEAVSLRKQIIQLIDQLVPNGHLESRLDFQSPLTDKFLNQLVETLTMEGHQMITCTSSGDAVPLVSLCPDPAHCVDALRTQIYRLLRILVPHLHLPQSFRIDRDLESLLSMLHECNHQPD
ncbi:hypothetical protein FGIG_08437 [Fasciola gigantica]|uniref:Uncharacterized protein n=1 Tax=Fasciola gigantica TaxID=46835 RepID=A0A504YZA3_FASGI|nr:hypothetical protein FGIG_08437 [Fasciola gigantica]